MVFLWTFCLTEDRTTHQLNKWKAASVLMELCCMTLVWMSVWKPVVSFTASVACVFVSSLFPSVYATWIWLYTVLIQCILEMPPVIWLVMEIYFGIFQAVLEWIWYQERYDAVCFWISSRSLGGESSGLHWYNLVLSSLNFVFLVLLLFLQIGYYAITHFIVFQWQFGEKFTMNCQDCICLEGEHGIVCEPHVCEQKKVTCDGEGFYEVTEVNPEDSCCPLFTCSEFIHLF